MDTIKPLLHTKNGYCMRLGNGQGWHIIATEGRWSWIKKLASIMELKQCEPNGYPKLIFTRKEKAKEGIEKPIGYLDPRIEWDLNKGGWKPRDFSAIRIWYHQDEQDVFCEIGTEGGHELDIIRKWLARYPIFERAQYSGGLTFHAALVKRKGIGILLAGSGNTGKSTCCQRLTGPWQALCDDEALVVRDDLNRYLVHPFPTWSDHLWRRSEKTWNVEGYVPLAAIFFLQQGKTDEVVPVRQGEAAVSIYQSAMQVYHLNWRKLDREELRVFRRKLFDNACELARVIPAFKLRVSLKGRFWEEMEKVLP